MSGIEFDGNDASDMSFDEQRQVIVTMSETLADIARDPGIALRGPELMAYLVSMLESSCSIAATNAYIEVVASAAPDVHAAAQRAAGQVHHALVEASNEIGRKAVAQAVEERDAIETALREVAERREAAERGDAADRAHVDETIAALEQMLGAVDALHGHDHEDDTHDEHDVPNPDEPGGES